MKISDMRRRGREDPGSGSGRRTPEPLVEASYALGTALLATFFGVSAVRDGDWRSSAFAVAAVLWFAYRVLVILTDRGAVGADVLRRLRASAEKNTMTLLVVMLAGLCAKFYDSRGHGGATTVVSGALTVLMAFTAVAERRQAAEKARLAQAGTPFVDPLTNVTNEEMRLRVREFGLKANGFFTVVFGGLLAGTLLFAPHDNDFPGKVAVFGVTFLVLAVVTLRLVVLVRRDRAAGTLARLIRERGPRDAAAGIGGPRGGAARRYCSRRPDSGR